MAKRGIGALFDSIWNWGERGWKIALFVVTSLAAGGTGWAAQASAWLNHYGPISWVIAGLLGGLLFALLWLALTKGIESYHRSQWIKTAAQPFDTVNPLESVFTGRVIDANAFRRPLPGEFVEGKTFVNCELRGPTVIALFGRVTIQDCGLMHCDFVAVPDGTLVGNAIAFKDLTIRGGKVYSLTILVPAGIADSIPAGANWISAK